MPKIGDTIGRFTVLEELGRGVMSEVFLVVESDTRWKAAFKIFLLEPGSSPHDEARWAQRMVREATLAARLQDERVVRVHELGLLGGAPYLIRDFIAGKPLSEYVGDRSRGAIDRKLRWLRDLAAVLAEIHRAGLVHRDVKPSSVVIRRDGALRLLDFGVGRRSMDREVGLLAACADPADPRPRPRARGTPAYMAPERFALQGASPAADQFGWGVVAYELLAGRLPWCDGRDGARVRAVKTIESILTETPPSVRDFAPKVPSEMGALVGRAMAKRPEDRFPTMDQLVAELEPLVR
jgi:serine/threonine protein kinase